MNLFSLYKYLIICVFLPFLNISFSNPAVTETATKGQAMLKHAFETTAGKDFIATVDMPLRFKELPKLTTACFFRRHYADGHVDMRLDLFAKKQCVASFWKNRQGQYASVGEKTFKGGDFNILFWLENLWLPIYKKEWLFNQYEISSEKYNDIPCDKISVIMTATKENRGKLGSMTGLYITNGKDADEAFESHSVYREFMIGQEDHVIYSRKHFNGNRQCMMDVNLGSVDFTPNWDNYPNIFSTPSEPMNYVLSDDEVLLELQMQQNSFISDFIKNQKKKPPQPYSPQSPEVALFIRKPSFHNNSTEYSIISSSIAFPFAKLPFVPQMRNTRGMKILDVSLSKKDILDNGGILSSWRIRANGNTYEIDDVLFDGKHDITIMHGPDWSVRIITPK